MLEAIKEVIEKELIGKQKKLDKNHNGKLDGQDFKMLRKEDKKCGCAGKCQCSTNEAADDYVDESMGDFQWHNSKDHKPLSSWPKVHAAVHRDFSQAGGAGTDAEKNELGKTPIHPDHHAVHNDAESNPKKMRKALNRHYSHDVSRGLDEEKAVKEEVEQVDEISAKLAANYVRNADRDAYTWHGPGKVSNNRTDGMIRNQRKQGVSLAKAKLFDRHPKGGPHRGKAIIPTNEAADDYEGEYQSTITKKQKAAQAAVPAKNKAYRDSMKDRPSIQSKLRREEIEQVDELTGIKKSPMKKIGYVMKAGEVMTKTAPHEIANNKETGRKFKNRLDGLQNLQKRMTKEEIEFSAEEIARIEAIAKEME
jgi:hypothetical protein